MEDIPTTDATSLLITVVGEVILAIWVDEVEGIFEIESERTFPTPAIVKSLHHKMQKKSDVFLLH